MADNPPNTFAGQAFKEELQAKAGEVQDSTSYAWEQHKSVAQDAAVMAASKSGDFAKAAESDFAMPQTSEGMIDMAKEKLGEGVEMVKEGLNTGMSTASQTMSGAVETVKDTSNTAYSSAIGTVSGAMETVREKIGEGLEFVAEKMKETGEAMIQKADETKSQGIALERQAELNQARIGLKPI